MFKLFKRMLVLVLVIGMIPSTAFTQSLQDSASREAANLAAQSQRPAARGENPYMVPGVVLLSAGGGLAILSFLAPTGISCKDQSTSTTFNFDCGTTANKGLLFGGLGAMAVGGLLLMKGERDRNRSPELVFHPGGVMVRERIRW